MLSLLTDSRRQFAKCHGAGRRRAFWAVFPTKSRITAAGSKNSSLELGPHVSNPYTYWIMSAYIAHYDK